MMDRKKASACVLALVALIAVEAGAARAADDRFAVTEAMIPMRDGVRLHTRIFRPKGRGEDLPILFWRTPYGIGNAERGFATSFGALVDEGYIFVFQDLRGKFGSEGTFVMHRPPRPEGDSEGARRGDRHVRLDRMDAQERRGPQWPRRDARHLLRRLDDDHGRLEPHPALKAISPQASPADMWLGDDFHHNGAFRLSYGFEYAAMMETGKETAPFTFDRHDTFDWYLSLGPLANVDARHLHGKIPTWNDFVAHPDYDDFWKRQTMIPHIRASRVPTLNVAGWWDQEDFFGPLEIYKALGATRPEGAQLPGRRPVEPRRLGPGPGR